jgi:hypothetical protein
MVLCANTGNTGAMCEPVTVAVSQKTGREAKLGVILNMRLENHGCNVNAAQAEKKKMGY